MNRLLFLLLVSAALLPLQSVHAFECTRASVQMEINKLRSKFESEALALNERQRRSRPSLSWTSRLPGGGAWGDINRALAAERAESEAHERASLIARQKIEALNFKNMVISKCK